MTFSMEVRQLYSWKLLSSCLKLSTYSFVYRECGLLQNEKVRERSSVTQIQTLFLCTLPNKFMDSLGQLMTAFLDCLKVWRILYMISYLHLSGFLFFSWLSIVRKKKSRDSFQYKQQICFKMWYSLPFQRFVCFILCY